MRCKKHLPFHSSLVSTFLPNGSDPAKGVYCQLEAQSLPPRQKLFPPGIPFFLAGILVDLFRESIPTVLLPPFLPATPPLLSEIID